MAAQHLDITVIGAGIFGVWQALTLARRGHRVQLLEASAEPFAASASRFAGAMIAPYCEEEAAEPIVTGLGLEAVPIWRETYPHIAWNGTLVVAAARDRSELLRFGRMSRGHRSLQTADLDALEPDLAGRFMGGLLYEAEGHMSPAHALPFLLNAAREAGCAVRLGAKAAPASVDGIVVDCRGLAARDALPGLRGVRGERMLVRARDVHLNRTVRLLHPRHPLYVVPWSDDHYLIGATVIESEDPSPMTVRSALELLGLAYALHPAFGEAEIVELGAGLRPAFKDNVPKIVVAGPRHIHVNGAYRHGFLLGPIMARMTAELLETGKRHPMMVVDA
jgi:glycine oxidase